MKILSGLVLLLVSVCSYAQGDQKPVTDHVDKLNSSKKPLIVLDGMKKGTGFDLKDIDPNSIESIEVVKDDSAKFHYGEAGKNGVIVITSKTHLKPTAPIAIMSTISNKPLWIIEGMKRDETFMKSLDPNDIESINVIKDSTSTAPYGDAGKNGVIIISLKKESVRNSIKKIE